MKGLNKNQIIDNMQKRVNNTKTEELIIADYKSQHDTNEVTKDNYFNKPFKEGYKRQLDFYAYLLLQKELKL